MRWWMLNKWVKWGLFKELSLWWFFLCMIFSCTIYFPAMRRKNLYYRNLLERFETLKKEKENALLEQEELLLQVNSQKEPAWVEMVLKRNLGVVPEGQIKVYFKKDR